MDTVKVPGAVPHAPVFVSSNIRMASRVVVFFGEVVENLGIFSYRDASDEGLSFGSILGVAKALLGENAHSSQTALILTNAGQNIWNNTSGTAMTPRSFGAQTRSSAVARDRPPTSRNIIPTNASISMHTQYIFEQVLMPSLPLGAKVDILGLSEGGTAAMTYLKDHCEYLISRYTDEDFLLTYALGNIWSPHVSCLTLINPQEVNEHDIKINGQNDPNSFAFFRRFRCRAWVLSNASIGTRVAGLNLYGCNTYSCGEGTKTSCMITRGLSHIRSWMNVMHRCPTAKEILDVLPGETDLNWQLILSLYSNVAVSEIPCGTVEVHSNAVLEQISVFLANLWLTVDKIRFFSNDGARDDIMQPGGEDGPENEGSFVYVKSGDHDGEASSAETVVHVVPPSAAERTLNETGAFDLQALQIIQDMVDK